MLYSGYCKSLVKPKVQFYGFEFFFQVSILEFFHPSNPVYKIRHTRLSEYLYIGSLLQDLRPVYSVLELEGQKQRSKMRSKVPVPRVSKNRQSL